MTTSSQQPLDRALLLERLARIRWRVRLNRGLRDLLTGFIVSGTIWIGLQRVAISNPTRALLMFAIVFGLAGWLGWRWARGATLARSAATADRRGELDDEMRSAYSFIHANRSSPWVDLHIERASKTASELDERELVPILPPRR